MSYIASNSIHVFPTSKRSDSAGDTYSRYFTEYAITNIINRLVNEDSFVITQSNSNASFNISALANLEFNIGGYYFNINDQALDGLPDLAGISSSNPYLVATAAIDTDAYGCRSLISVSSDGTPTNAMDSLDDESSNFQGINFTSSATYVRSSETNGNITTYKLTLLHLESNGNYTIPLDSKVRFRTPTLTIDDGEL